MTRNRGQFQPGQHWRPVQAFRERDWLLREYVEKQRSTGEIAAEFGVTDGAILFWLNRHGIPRRSIAEVRRVKHWSMDGAKNGMYGKRGAEVPSWKGGITPERQAFYSSLEWKAAVRAVQERDQNICQRCGVQVTGRRRPHIHHIVRFAVVALRVELSNLVTLCTACHGFVHSRANVAREFVREEVS
jgi:hypothetical protein